MKKQSGFTLIELVVAMAVLGLIMGAMVHLFGSSVTSLHVGARQEVVYEEAIKVIFGTGIWILLKEPIKNIK